MLKKYLSVLLAVMMVVSVMTVGFVTADAATSDSFTPDPDKFYFDVDGTGWTMGAKDKIAFYMVGGDFDTEANATKPLDWGAKKLQGTATAGESGIWEITPSAIKDKNGVTYTLTPGVQYKIVFAQVVSLSWKFQTCNLYFTTDCLGHVAYSDGTEMENDVDSSKKSKTVYWRDMDPEENGPVLCITSIGNVVGSCVEQGKTKYDLLVEFFSTPKTDFKDKTCYQNAHYYKCEISPEADGYKTEQQLIDDIGAGLGFTKDQVQQALNEQAVKDYFETSGLGCSWSYDDSTLPAGSTPTEAPHVHTPGDTQIENDTPSTCKEAGSYDEVVYCTECGEEISRETKYHELADHTPGDTQIENDTPSTCKVAGSYDEVVYCTVCGDEISRETKYHELAEHTPGEAVKENNVEPGCETPGGYDMVTYCDVCGDELGSVHTDVDPSGHIDPLIFVEEVPATTTQDGVKSHYKCDRCGKKFSDATGNTEVTDEELRIPAANVQGDADGDGEVTSVDVTVIQKVLAELEDELDPETIKYNEFAADADGDGEVDIIDATLIQRVLAEMTDFNTWNAKHPNKWSVAAD